MRHGGPPTHFPRASGIQIPPGKEVMRLLKGWGDNYLDNYRHRHNEYYSRKIVCAQYWRPGSDSGRVLSSMLCHLKISFADDAKILSACLDSKATQNLVQAET
jgi:hypothetical protein